MFLKASLEALPICLKRYSRSQAFELFEKIDVPFTSTSSDLSCFRPLNSCENEVADLVRRPSQITSRTTSDVHIEAP
jgi:hypothetical protein